MEVVFTLSECLYEIEYNRLVSFRKLKKRGIDKIENIVYSCIIGVDVKKYEYALIVKWLAAIT